jgi:hypothetical protein
MLRIATAAALALCQLTPTLAQAARLLPVVRSVGAGSDKAAALVGHYVDQSLSADGRYERVDLSHALGNPDRDRALKAFGQAEDLLRQARQAYDTLELDKSVSALTGALGRFEHYVAYVNDFKKLAEALMLLGATHILRGEDKLGAKRLEQAVGIYPEVEPDPRIFNPSMRKLFTQTVERSHSKPSATLSVSSTPSAAEVFVDGRFVGVTPLALSTVHAGRHWVRVGVAAYRPWGKILELSPDKQLDENAQLRPMAQFEAYDGLVEQAMARDDTLEPGERLPPGGPLNKLAELAHADGLLLAQVRLDGEKVRLRLHQLDLAGNHLLRAADHSFTYDGQLPTYEHEVEQLWRLKFGSAVPAGPVHLESPPPAEAGGLMHAGEARCLGGARCSTVKWVTVGVTGAIGVGLMGIGGIEWARAKQDATAYAKQLQVSEAAATLANHGKATARLGDLFFGAGALVTLTSAALLVWWDPTPSSDAFVAPNSDSLAPPAASFRLAPLPGGGFVGANLRF